MVNIGALVNPSFAWIKKELCLDKKEICLDKIFAPAPGSQCPRKGTFYLLAYAKDENPTDKVSPKSRQKWRKFT